MTHHEHENKHIKVTVRYIGKPEHEYYNHNYLLSDTILQVKKDAIRKFEISATPDQYCLQYEDYVLIDDYTLKQSSLAPRHERYTLDLVAKEKQDTDGD